MSTDSPRPATAAAEREFQARVAAVGGQAPDEGPQQPPDEGSNNEAPDAPDGAP